MTADDLTRIAVTGSAVRTAEEPLLAAGRGPELMLSLIHILTLPTRIQV